jgi:hypothetical protein
MLWRVFTPLARDASAGALREVLDEIRARTSAPDERAALYTAILMMADLDPWGHNLKEEIKAMMQAEYLEALKLFPTLREAFDEGAEKGAEKERQKLLVTALAAQMGRAPTADEEAGLAKRAIEVGPEQAIRTLIALHGDALVGWVLGDGNARARKP